MDAHLKYCQGMLYLCQAQAKEWSRIKGDLSMMYVQVRSNNIEKESTSSISAQPNQVPPQPAVPAVDDPARVRFRMRIAHIIRGVIFIFALGLPRVFYYIYAGYALLVISGLIEELQSVQVRHFFTGSRPSLDLQLVRLRQRKEYLERLSDGREIDPEEERRMMDFLATFDSPKKPWYLRFIYQLFLMLFYSALPSCYPHGEFLS